LYNFSAVKSDSSLSVFERRLRNCLQRQPPSISLCTGGHLNHASTTLILPKGSSGIIIIRAWLLAAILLMVFRPANEQIWIQY
jgi:hypothetical protein